MLVVMIFSDAQVTSIACTMTAEAGDGWRTWDSRSRVIVDFFKDLMRENGGGR